MKKAVLFLFIALSVLVYAGTSRNVYVGVIDPAGNPYDFSSSPYDGVIFKFWIGTRPSEIIDQNSVQAGYETFGIGASVFYCDIGVFSSEWSPGDWLYFYAEDSDYGGVHNCRSDFVILDSSTDPVFIGLDYWFGSGYGGEPLMLTEIYPGAIESSCLPDEITLFQNYPNPFNPETEINFSLPKEEQVKLSVFNSGGQLVKQLVNGKRPAGNHLVNFNASHLNSGIYFYTLETGNTKLSKKMLLIK